MNGRTSYGRRKADRWRMGIGLALGLLLAGAVLSKVGCDGTTATGSSPVAKPNAKPTASPSPAAGGTVGTPTAVLPDEPNKAFELSCLDSSTISVKYTGGASRAAIDTWYTSLDDQDTAFAKQSHQVNSGDTVTRSFGVSCIQGDADQPGVKLIGGCFFDKDGKPFIPSRNPEKVTACRTKPCDPASKESWIEDAEYSDGQWGSCSPDNQPPNYASAATQQCFKKKTRTWTSINVCTKEKRYRTVWVYDECECQCVETQEPRETPGTFSWAPEILQGKCEVEAFPIGIATTPQLNCRQIGTQKIAVDWLCKADTEKIRDLCRNVACPTPSPTCENTSASYKSGANGGLFNLANSGDAAELAWVNTYVGLGPWEKFDDEGEKDDDCTSADVSAKVVIVKAGSSQSIAYSYRTYLNVTAGQQLCSYDPPGNDKAKDISHVTYFRCD